MKKFIYTCINDNVTLESDGTLLDVAAEVGRVAHTLYSAYFHQNPELAETFRMMVTATITHPESPTWNVRKNIPGDIEIICETPSEDGE